jgi:cytochrome P450
MLSRVFRPRKIAELEPKIREFCARSLDPLVGSGGFDFIANLGAEMPMRTIGFLLGIPEEDQEAIRDAIDASLRLGEDGKPAVDGIDPMAMANMFADYVDWRAKHPSDDLMTEMLNAEFEDVDGSMRKLTRDELLGYINLIAAAGNETTTRLIGWTGKVLAENPDQRADLVADPSLIPNAIEELLRYEAPSPVQARYITADVEHHGQTIEKGNVVLLLTAAANRDERKFSDPDRFDVRRKIERHVTFGYGVHFCLGASLARLEGQIALDEVLKRFPTWDVDYDKAIQARTSTVRGWETLPVITK